MDDLDRAQELEERDRELAIANARRPAVAPSSDGLCEDCGAPIPAARLAALPEARRCVDCQGSVERT